MKKIFYSILAAAAILTACNDEVMTDGTGSMSLNVSEITDQYVTKASDVDYSNFYVTITGPNGYKYESIYANMPKTLDNLPSGPYNVKVASHVETPAALFDTPVYAGSSDFTVKTGAVVPVTVRCTLQNVKVTIKPSSDFLSELDKYTVTVTNGAGTLHWSNDDAVTGTNVSTDINVPGNFSVAPLDVRVTGYRSLSGETASWDGKIAEVAAADHHTINVTARTTGAINGGITIEIIGTTNDKTADVIDPGFEEIPDNEGPDTGENGDYEEGGEGGNSENITLSWPGNESLEPMEIKQGMSVEPVINAAAGIKTFVIRLESDTPAFMSICSEMTSNKMTAEEAAAQGYVLIDLIDDPAAVQSMAAVGLTTGENLKGKTSAPFSLSTLVPMIPTAGQAGSGTEHTFTLTVTDANDECSSWALTFFIP